MNKLARQTIKRESKTIRNKRYSLDQMLLNGYYTLYPIIKDEIANSFLNIKQARSLIE